MKLCWGGEAGLHKITPAVSPPKLQNYQLWISISNVIFTFCC